MCLLRIILLTAEVLANSVLMFPRLLPSERFTSSFSGGLTRAKHSAKHSEGASFKKEVLPSSFLTAAVGVLILRTVDTRTLALKIVATFKTVEHEEPDVRVRRGCHRNAMYSIGKK